MMVFLVQLGPTESLTCENGGTFLISIGGDASCECTNWFTGDTCKYQQKAEVDLIIVNV